MIETFSSLPSRIWGNTFKQLIGLVFYKKGKILHLICFDTKKIIFFKYSSLDLWCSRRWVSIFLNIYVLNYYDYDLFSLQLCLANYLIFNMCALLDENLYSELAFLTLFPSIPNCLIKSALTQLKVNIQFLVRNGTFYTSFWTFLGRILNFYI